MSASVRKPVVARRRPCWRAPAALLALAPLLSGCFLGTERPDLDLEVPPHYRFSGKINADAAVPVLAWWRGFRSPELTKLMESAQLYNLDIAVAIAQIVQADAQVGVGGAGLLPSISGNANAERDHTSSQTASGGGGSTFSQHSLGLSASYMLDFWGKARAQLHANEENATASRYNRDVVTLITLATVANTYFGLLAAQDEMGVTRRNLEASERILTLVQKQFNGG